MKKLLLSCPWLFLLGIYCTILGGACSDPAEETPSVDLLSVTANGIPLVDGTINVATDVTFELVFSAAIDAARFEGAFSINGPGGAIGNLSFSYQNAASRAVISTTLEANTEYRVRVAGGVIGQNNGILDETIIRNFTTRDGGTVTELSPCVSADPNCLGRLAVRNSAGGQGEFTFYNSFPLDLENARWENLRSALIVTHGVNRDADNYFSYLMSTLRSEDLEDETLLIAPYFKGGSDAEAGQLFWSNSSWREGQPSSDAVGVSSFSVIDQVLDILGDRNRFPVLENVIIAGHSSGALFSHAYAAASARMTEFPEIDFSFVVANSQYFYYPRDVRFDADSGTFTEVSGCSTFNQWPLGFVNPPPYLGGIPKTTVDERITTRRITYLLGNRDVVTTGTLNTRDCEAVLLGENRFRRGENIHLLIETNFADVQQSEKVIVDGIGHNGQAMFQSSEFSQWLRDRVR
jgi:pimeloyl-ACP methyl ester carboxylesterase